MRAWVCVFLGRQKNTEKPLILSHGCENKLFPLPQLCRNAFRMVMRTELGGIGLQGNIRANSADCSRVRVDTTQAGLELDGEKAR